MSNKLAITSLLLVLVMVISACGQAASVSPSNANGSTPSSAGSVTLNGAGATFPQPVYTEWALAYQSVDPSVTINYQGIGSGGGKKGIEDKTIDFAGSDALLTPDEYTANPTLQMFPTVAGAVVPIFNAAPEVTTNLALNGPVLAGIYLGKITKWNDPAIAALNPGVTLPDKNITAVHRSDGSGTTEIFTKFLAAVSADWKNGPGAGQAVEWPVDKAGNGIGGKGNPGVAAAVQNTPYSIGYVELQYATANKIPFASMVNAAGKTITADAASLAAAMTDYGDKFDNKLTIDMISNGPGQDSWPIVGYTYMVIYKDMAPYKGSDCIKAQKYLDFVHWALSDPQAAKIASDLGYATLPPTVRDKVFAMLATVTCDGKPLNFAK